jgi:DNA-binding GntR family transcriptional regulator
VRHDLEFHQALVRTMGSSRLRALYDAAQGEMRLALTLIDSTYTEPQLLIDEHREMLDALRDGDTERAANLFHEHLDEAEEQVVRLMEQTDTAA